MPTQFKIADVEQALIALLAANSALVALKVQAVGLSSKNWDDQGSLLVTPPAALVLFEQTGDDGSRDTVRKDYQSFHDFAIFCGASDLSSAGNERTGCYNIIAAVRAAIAGVRLTIDGGSNLTAPIELTGVSPEQFDSSGVWYAVRARIRATAQF